MLLYILIILFLLFILRRKNIKMSYYDNIIIEYTDNIFNYSTICLILLWPISIFIFLMKIYNKFGPDFLWLLELIMMIDSKHSLIII